MLNVQPLLCVVTPGNGCQPVQVIACDIELTAQECGPYAALACLQTCAAQQHKYNNSNSDNDNNNITVTVTVTVTTNTGTVSVTVMVTVTVTRTIYK